MRKTGGKGWGGCLGNLVVAWNVLRRCGSAGRYAVPASVRESRLEADSLVSPEGK